MCEYTTPKPGQHSVMLPVTPATATPAQRREATLSFGGASQLRDRPCDAQVLLSHLQPSVNKTKPLTALTTSYVNSPGCRTGALNSLAAKPGPHVAWGARGLADFQTEKSDASPQGALCSPWLLSQSGLGGFCELKQCPDLQFWKQLSL